MAKLPFRIIKDGSQTRGERSRVGRFIESCLASSGRVDHTQPTESAKPRVGFGYGHARHPAQQVAFGKTTNEAKGFNTFRRQQ